MPKPVKKTGKLPERKKPARHASDPNRRVHQMMAEHMAQVAEPVDQKAIISAHMKAIGSKGGTVSGAKRMEMPARQRKAIAKKAAAARWSKEK